MTHYANAGTILVVDDEPGNIALVSRLMQGLGYQVATATNGEDALEAVPRVRPDIILLDVNMPRLDGFEVCRRLKNDAATRLIPVVLLTGFAAVADRVRGIEAGADDFLTKPFVIAELNARVRSLTRLKRYTDELDSAEAVILSLALTIEARDPYTQGHGSVWPSTRRRSAGTWGCPRRSRSPCAGVDIFTTWARSGSRMRCC